MNEETRISAGGGEDSKWLPDGSAVYYRNGSKWMKVSLKLEGEPEIGEPELFFEGDYLNVWGPSHASSLTDESCCSKVRNGCHLQKLMSSSMRWMWHRECGAWPSKPPNFSLKT